jgi:hypothetical protein
MKLQVIEATLQNGRFRAVFSHEIHAFQIAVKPRAVARRGDLSHHHSATHLLTKRPLANT